MKASISELTKAVVSLETSINLFDKKTASEDEKAAFRDACIQRFEYTIELSWKISMKTIGSTAAAAKPAIREMARNNLIANPDTWMIFIEARNESSHSYDENVAQKVFSSIRLFLPEVKKLISELEKIK